MYVTLKILELLKRETDEEHPLRQKEIIELLKKENQQSKIPGNTPDSA